MKIELKGGPLDGSMLNCRPVAVGDVVSHQESPEDRYRVTWFRVDQKLGIAEYIEKTKGGRMKMDKAAIEAAQSMTAAAVEVSSVMNISPIQALHVLIRAMRTEPGIDMGRQNFVIVLDDGQPYRVVYVRDTWVVQCVAEGLKAPPYLPVTDEVALALLELPVFDLVKDDGTVLEDHGHGAGGE